MGSVSSPRVYELEAVTGVFMQSEPMTDPTDFDNAAQNFGLIHRKYPTDQNTVASVSTDWQRFMRYVRYLESSSGDAITYKLLFLGRHGEGYHNVAEAYYGTKDWDDYWSKLDGNGTISWFDAHLTDVGVGSSQSGGRIHESANGS